MRRIVIFYNKSIEDDGIEVAQTLHKEGSSVRILAFSAHNDRWYIQEFLESGASGYLNKEEGPEFILAAVRGVASGEKGWVSPEIITQYENSSTRLMKRKFSVG